jgi:hypothetical protein
MNKKERVMLWFGGVVVGLVSGLVLGAILEGQYIIKLLS